MKARFALFYVHLLIVTWASSVASDPTEQFAFGPSLHIPSHSEESEILQDILKAQAQRSTNYFPRKSYPPLQWSRQKGIFDSFVHLNFHGQAPAMPLLRNVYHFPDDNAFVTMFVLEALLDIAMFNRTNLPVAQNVINNGVHAVSYSSSRNLWVKML